MKTSLNMPMAIPQGRFHTVQAKPRLRFSGTIPVGDNQPPVNPSQGSKIGYRFRKFMTGLAIALTGAGGGILGGHQLSQKGDAKLYEKVRTEISASSDSLNQQMTAADLGLSEQIATLDKSLLDQMSQSNNALLGHLLDQMSQGDKAVLDQMSQADSALFEQVMKDMNTADKLLLQQLVTRMTDADKEVLAKVGEADSALHRQIVNQMVLADEALQNSIMDKVAKADSALQKQIVTDLLQKMGEADEALEARLYQNMLQQMATQNRELRHVITESLTELTEKVVPESLLKNQIKLLNKMIVFPSVINRVAPANVMVQGPNGRGSGTFFQDKKGDVYILTNNHVVRDNAYENGKYKIHLYSHSEAIEPSILEGEVVISNGEKDLAVIKVDSPGFKPSVIIKRDQIRDLQKEPLMVGEAVFTVGNPLGMTHNVTVGVVSHVDRKNPWNGAQLDFQVDAPINPGNSGGALYDSQGRLVGVPSWIMRNSDGIGGVIKVSTAVDWLKSQGIDIQ